MKKQFSDKKGNTKTNQKQPSVVKMLRNLKQIKWYTGAGTLTSSSSTMSFVDLTTPAQGTASNQRIGTSINLREVLIKGNVIVGDTTNVVRFLVFRWLVDNNSDVPGADELFDSATDVYSGTTRYDPKRYKILFDKMYLLNAYHPSRLMDIKIDLGDSLATFSSGTSGQNHVYCATISDSTAIPHPTLAWSYQLQWRDSE